MCLQFLWFLLSPLSLLAHALPTQGSENSVTSKTIHTVNRMNSETIGIVGRIPRTQQVGSPSGLMIAHFFLI